VFSRDKIRVLFNSQLIKYFFSTNTNIELILEISFVGIFQRQTEDVSSNRKLEISLIGKFTYYTIKINLQIIINVRTILETQNKCDVFIYKRISTSY